MALPLTSRDKDLLLSAFGLPETRDRVVALLDLAGTGNMTGPGSATDNALVRFDGTTGALVQNSIVTLSDAGELSGVTAFAPSGQILASDGTIALPEYSFSADPDTGAYREGANTMAFSAGASRIFKIQPGSAEVTDANRLFIPAGSAAAPSLGLGSLTSGLYSSSAAAVDIATSGVNRIEFSGAGTEIVSGRLFIPDGAAATPSLNFTSDQNTGIYSIGADQLGFSAGGALRFSLSTTAVTSTLPVAHSSGSAAAPGITFSANLDMGFFRGAATEMDASVGGVDVFRFATTAITSFQPHYFQDGLAATPSIAFNADQDTGIFRAGADDLRIVAGGVEKLSAQAVGVEITGTNRLFIPDGTGALPSLTFSLDTDTGISLVGANNIAISAGGAARFHVNGSVIQIGETGDTTSIHQINGGLQAPAAGALTLTNGPGASTGDPTVYLTLNINGTNYVVPAWVF